eukprot:jgi/Chlat1/3029/Chrsp203S03283
MGAERSKVRDVEPSAVAVAVPSEVAVGTVKASEDGKGEERGMERRHKPQGKGEEALFVIRLKGKGSSRQHCPSEQQDSQPEHDGDAAMLSDWLATASAWPTAAHAEHAPQQREDSATDRGPGHSGCAATANSDHARIMSAVAVLAVKCGAVAASRGASPAAQRWVRAGALVAAVQAFGRLVAQRREKALRRFRLNLQFRSPQLEAEFRSQLAPHATKDLVRAFVLAITLVVLGGACHAGAVGPAAITSPAWWAALASLMALLLAGWWVCVRYLNKGALGKHTPITSWLLTSTMPVAINVAMGVGFMLSWVGSGPKSRPLWQAPHQKIVLLVAFSFVYHLVKLSGVRYAVAASALITFNAVAYAATPPATTAEKQELARMNLYITLILFLHLIASFSHEHTERKRFLLAKEVDSEQGLLTQMLPQRIIRTLKANPGSLIADKYCNVTIMFVALQGFADLVASTPAKRLINFLNGVFSEFDALCAHHSVYKIETVGDTYLAGAGLLDGDNSSDDNGREHARRAAALARDLIRVQMLLESVKTNIFHNIPLQLKVGLHSGPVVAGIIGAKRLFYRAFGDTVNTASRMCSHGLPGKVHMSGATKELLEGSGFAVFSRGVIEVKGKGPMETFFLEQDVDDSQLYNHGSLNLFQTEDTNKVSATVRSVAQLLLRGTNDTQHQHPHHHQHDNQHHPPSPLLAAAVSPFPSSPSASTMPPAKRVDGLASDIKDNKGPSPGSRRRTSMSLDFINMLLPRPIATTGQADHNATDDKCETKHLWWWRSLPTLLKEKLLHPSGSGWSFSGGSQHSGQPTQRPTKLPKLLEVNAATTTGATLSTSPAPTTPAELETAYQRDNDKATLRQMQLVVGLCCSALLPYTLFDILQHRPDAWLAVAFSLRLAYTSVALVALVYMSVALRWPRHRVRALTQQRLMTGLAVAGSVVVMALAAMRSEGYDSVNEEVVMTMTITLPVVMLACGLTFVHAAAAAVCAVALFGSLVAALLNRHRGHTNSNIVPVDNAHIAAGIISHAIEFLFLMASVRQQECRMRGHFLLQKELVKQNRMSSNLIHDLVPPQIGMLLKRGMRSIVDHYSETTCLFSDMVGFTPLSMALGAHRLVLFLNRLYTTFDSLCDKHRVYKVNIIGDAYVCVAGVPVRDDAHTAAAVEMARSMLHAIDALRDELLIAANTHAVSTAPQAKSYEIAMRIGLHSGPVVAGVVGIAALRYEVWGETVRIANKMESSGRPGCVHLSQECIINIKESHQYKHMLELVEDGTAFLADDRCFRH